MASPSSSLTAKSPDHLSWSAVFQTYLSHLRIPRQFIFYISLGQNNLEFLIKHFPLLIDPLCPLASEKQEVFPFNALSGLLDSIVKLSRARKFKKKIIINHKSSSLEPLRVNIPQKPFLWVPSAFFQESIKHYGL